MVDEVDIERSLIHAYTCQFMTAFRQRVWDESAAPGQDDGLLSMAVITVT